MFLPSKTPKKKKEKEKLKETRKSQDHVASPCVNDAFKFSYQNFLPPFFFVFMINTITIHI